MGDTGRHRVDILEHSGVFHPDHIAGELATDVRPIEVRGHVLGDGLVLTSDRQVREVFHRHFLGMARTGDGSDTTGSYLETLGEILPHHDVLLGEKPLDGRKKDLAFHRDLHPADLLGEKRGRDRKDDRIGIFDHLVDVAADAQLRSVELHGRKVIGIVMLAPQVIRRRFRADVPPHAIHVFTQHLDDGRCPTATAHDCYFVVIFVHNCCRAIPALQR